MPNGIKEQILASYQRLASDPHHRYRSWEHCFTHFRQRATFTSEEDIDTASLHLAFYLASWGMYRGSSALLWKDYRIHQPAILKLLAPQFDILWDLDIGDSTHDRATAELIVSLSTALRTIYRQEITTVDSAPRDFNASDTLITKFLLGTVGCTPACDRYFVFGFRHVGLRYTRFNATFLFDVFQFCREHRDIFLDTQEVIARRSKIRYPLMKLADMYFWKIGFDLLPEENGDEASDA